MCSRYQLPSAGVCKVKAMDERTLPKKSMILFSANAMSKYPMTTNGEAINKAFLLPTHPAKNPPREAKINPDELLVAAKIALSRLLRFMDASVLFCN